MRFGLERDRLLQVLLRVVPARFAEHLAAKEILGDHARQAVEPHHLGVPHAHHVQRAGVLRIDLERVERLVRAPRPRT